MTAHALLPAPGANARENPGCGSRRGGGPVTAGVSDTMIGPACALEPWVMG